ncbi:rfaE bifunctional protein kinase chain/domain/rfaE bifunctional protein nucleotidyltransferase chain/domain [Motilibacter rhizosphaerae]|uniref:D-glycero-beta-D-manno-heptose 1-phosphate adenylyltransferase n=1 Tax=Motilibacter rhizosphaerae TaxID=598652 RepID=A0A4Q7NFR8_9ACTN|nr:D-glycero-beta-D-manno-heptose 1-phosphate adenylyltransferase [Motilibacter rhizosphaerae]RZS82740.1 rfaE bifunctional protein kinase chain/domain/rfaE bifunctional protein nucleotidyltransferase chain/domain [Motilibacter rhizosphaerae]
MSGTGPLVVVGDALLDVDLLGAVERVAPDAPVPVLDVVEEVPRPGGAALAALLAARDGREVVLVTPLGDDEGAQRLRALLAGTVRVVGLPWTGTTAVKTRVRSAGQSLVRIDTGGAPGSVTAVTPEAEQVLQGAGAVLVADYGRGATASEPLRALLAATAVRVPVVWDPHPRGSAPVAGVRLVTPNAAEAAGASGVPGKGVGPAAAQAQELVRRWGATAVSVTLGARGALVSYGDGAPLVVPAPPVACVDPCGAGDRFASAAAGLLADGALPTEAVQGAVAAASAFVAAGGAASVRVDAPAPAAAPPAGGSVAEPTSGSAADVIARVRAAGGTVVATGGCFDLLHAGHVATLEAARALGDCLVVCLNSDDSVRRLKGPERPLQTEDDRARVLGALGCVDAVVVFGEDTPEAVLAELRPDVWAKGGDYAGADLPEARLVQGWGGAAVVLPYLDGRSTTSLVATARRTGTIDLDALAGATRPTTHHSTKQESA